MAYPVVSAPYGLLPQNLIGGQVFAGSTRMYNIQYGYATSIFYGDFVVLSRGFATRASVNTGLQAPPLATAKPTCLMILMLCSRLLSVLLARPFRLALWR